METTLSDDGRTRTAVVQGHELRVRYLGELESDTFSVTPDVLRNLGEENLRRLIHIKRGDNLAQAPEYRHRQAEIDKAEAILDKLIAEDACFSLKQLAVNGRDVMQLGLKGPAIGRALDKLLDDVVNGEIPNEREVLLERMKGLAAADTACSGRITE